MHKILLQVLVIALIVMLVPQGIAVAQSGTGTYDDNSTTLTSPNHYIGNWSLGTGASYANAINGTVHYTSDPNASVSFSFTGTSITLFYTAAYNRGFMHVSISNAFVNESVNQYATEVRRQVAKTWTVPSGIHTITVSSDCAGTCGLIDVDAFVVNFPTTGLGSYDDFDPTLVNRYVGSWTSTANGSPAAYQNTLHWSDTPGSIVRLHFTGNQIKYIFSRGPDRGAALVMIDGLSVGTIDEYSADASYPRQYYITYTGLGSGVHDLNITVASIGRNSSTSGYRVDLDALEVPNCPGNLSICRAYSRVYLETLNDYTSLGGFVTVGNPIIRDSATNSSFSGEVFWIGQRRWTQASWIEGGWQFDQNPAHSGLPFTYYQAFQNYNIVSDGATSISFGSSLSIRLDSQVVSNPPPTFLPNCRWTMTANSVNLPLLVHQVADIDIGICAGNIRAGGEVTDGSLTLHNGMGPSTFSSLWYRRNFATSDTLWTGWDFQTRDYLYTFSTGPNTSFSNSGY